MAGKARLTPEEAARRKRERQRRWYYANREREVAKARTWNQANRDRFNATMRRYAERNKDHRAATHRAWIARTGYSSTESVRRWRAANPELARIADRKRFVEDRAAYYAYQRAYAKAHPLMGRLRVSRRRALLRNAEGSFTLAEWQEKCALFANLCAYCGEAKPLTIDHRIPLARGGSNWITNVVPACASCNKTKQDMTDAEFLVYRERSVLRPR